MPEIILPSTMVGLLATFEPCFHAPTYRVLQLVLAGWMHCLGRRTVTAVALASGGVGQRHISVFHRFFTRATWSLDAVGQGELPVYAWRAARTVLVALLAREWTASASVCSRGRS